MSERIIVLLIVYSSIFLYDRSLLKRSSDKGEKAVYPYHHLAVTDRPWRSELHLGGIAFGDVSKLMGGSYGMP